MSNFRELLDKPAEEFKRPPAWPDGTYLCRIGRGTIVENQDPEKSSFIRVTFKPMKPFELPDGTTDIEDGALTPDYTEKFGREVFNQRFFISADALHRFTKQFCEQGVGLRIGGKTVRQLLEELPDKLVGVKVRQVPGFRDPEPMENEVSGFMRAE